MALNRLEYRVLAFLKAENRFVGVGELAFELGVEKESIRIALESLEGQGLVVKSVYYRRWGYKGNIVG